MSCSDLLRKSFPSVFLLLCLFSCIDEGYDLSDLDTDVLTVGDKWSLKLAVGNLSASDILDVDNVEEIFADDNGDLIARYSNVISVLPQAAPAIKDQSFVFAPSYPDMSELTEPDFGDFEIPIPLRSREMEVVGSDQIHELHHALFDTGPGKSLLTVEMRTDGFTIDGGYATIEISLPDGYELDTQYLPEGIYSYNNEVQWWIELGDADHYSVSIPVSRVDCTGDNTATVSGVIGGPSGIPVSVGSQPETAFTIRLENLDYMVIYGRFGILFESTPKTASISSLYDIFEGDDAVLSFREPYIIISTLSNIGMPVAAVLDIYPDTEEPAAGRVSVENIVIPAASSYGNTSQEWFWIGETDPARTDYLFRYARGVGGVIKNSRQELYLAGSGQSLDGGVSQFYPSEALAELDYRVEIPLAPAGDFYAVSLQTVTDVFSDDMVEYLFSGRTAEIYGSAVNSLPLRFDLELIITDGEGSPVDISFPIQEIAAPVSGQEPSVSEIGFLFREEDMARMADARDMVLRFIAYGTDDERVLNREHELALDLKLRKSGGIQVGSKDDQ